MRHACGMTCSTAYRAAYHAACHADAACPCSAAYHAACYAAQRTMRRATQIRHAVPCSISCGMPCSAAYPPAWRAAQHTMRHAMQRSTPCGLVCCAACRAACRAAQHAVPHAMQIRHTMRHANAEMAYHAACRKCTMQHAKLQAIWACHTAPYNLPYGMPCHAAPHTMPHAMPCSAVHYSACYGARHTTRAWHTLQHGMAVPRHSEIVARRAGSNGSPKFQFSVVIQ